MLAMEVNDDAGSLTPRGALRFFASMLAMVVNDNALNQMPRGTLGFFASMLAPTGDPGTAVKVRSALRPPRFAVDRRRPVNHEGRTQALRSG